MRRQTSSGEILQAPGQSLRLFGESLSAGLRTSLPGIIRSFDRETQTAVIQPAVMENLGGTAQPLPLLQDVPVFWMGGASHASILTPRFDPFARSKHPKFDYFPNNVDKKNRPESQFPSGFHWSG